jgi:hypothetical protein
MMHSELRKAPGSLEGAQRISGCSVLPNNGGDFLELLPLKTSTSTYNAGSSHVHGDRVPEAVLAALQPSNNQASPQIGGEAISNPLGLLADASGAAQALELQSVSTTTSPSSPESSNYSASPAAGAESRGLARYLLRRPGYVSLGLKLSNDSLEQGLDALLAAGRREYRYSHYFKPAKSDPKRDTGPDLDPIDLGLVSMDTANYLFPM